jgi:hypothetical protein
VDALSASEEQQTTNSAAAGAARPAKVFVINRRRAVGAGQAAGASAHDRSSSAFRRFFGRLFHRHQETVVGDLGDDDGTRIQACTG